jgi:hypothetical protein
VPAAEINVEVDGTPGSEDMPGKLNFLTTNSGSPTPTLKMTILQNGFVGIGGADPEANLDVRGNSIVQSGSNKLILDVDAGYSGNAGLWAEGSHIVVGSATNNDFFIFLNNSETLQITRGTGKVSYTSHGGTGAHEFVGDAVVTGDLTVNGATMTVSTTNMVVEDNLIELGNGTTGVPGNDSGLIIERGDSNNALLFWDESEDKWTLGTSTSATAGDTGNIADFTAGALVANLEGDVTGGTITASGNLTVDTDTLFVDASGDKVGIGTTGPSQKLDVHNGNIRAFNSTNAVSTLLIADVNDAVLEGQPKASVGDLYIKTGTAATDIIFQSISSEKMRITSSGNVGIGTDNPIQQLTVGSGISGTTARVAINSGAARDATLDLYKNTGAFGTAGPTGFRVQFDGIANTFNIQSGDDTTVNTRLTIERDSGNVGIGTTTPQSKLDIEGSATIGSTYSGTNAAPADGLLIEGNVGIGTTTPQSKLDVEGSVAIGSTYSGTNAAPTDGLLVEGNVGIGTTAPFVLGSGKTALTMGDGTTINWKHGANAASRVWGLRPDMEAYGDFCIMTADAQDEALDTYRLYIDPAGNIGIGTTNPGAPLDFSTTQNEDKIHLGASDVGMAQKDGTDMVLFANTGGEVLFARGGRTGYVKMAVDMDAGGVSIGHNVHSNTPPTSGLYVEGDVEIAGNVGVGGAVPTVALEVAGEAKVNSYTAVATGAGMDAAGVTMYVSKINGEIVTTILLDLDGGIEGDNVINSIIGENGIGNAYITGVTTAVNGFVYKGEMSCIEAPAGGSADIDLVANDAGLAQAATVVDHVLVNDGAWTVGKLVEFTIPTGGIAGDFLHLAEGTADGTQYSAGKFVIKLYGASF